MELLVALSLLAAGVKKNDEVLVSGTSFVSSANSIIYCDATPHFVDIESKTFGIDTNKLQKYLEKITKLKTENVLIKKLETE